MPRTPARAVRTFDLEDFLQAALRGARGVADVRPDGSLELRLEAEGRTATLTLPKDEAPGLLLETPEGLSKAERLSAIRVSPLDLVPWLRADLDEQGRVLLRPTWGEGVTATPGSDWHFDGATYHPLGSAPRELARYFRGIRAVEEDDLPAFLEGEFKELSRSPAFRPHPAVAETRVGPRLSLVALRVKPGTGDWLDLDPVYAAGSERVAQSELDALKRGKRFLRRGNVLFPTEPDRRWTGPVRMRRAEFILRRPKLGLPLEGDLPGFDPLASDPAPQGLQATLRGYQKTGYEWMRYLRRAGLHGVLADDMGLGKTVQTIAFLLSLYEEGARRPSLIVAPTSVLDGWMEKMRAFGPALRPYRYYGPSRKPEALRLPGQRAVVTTYSLLARDIDALSAMDWECVIVDEAQYIKTTSTQYAQAAKRLSAGTRVALTGTPIENRLDELRSIFDFILPGYLGSAESFQERFAGPIAANEDADALEELKRMIAPFKLRRLKADVLQDLPPKVEDVRKCDLSEQQSVLYKAVLERDGKTLAAELRDRRKRVDYVSVFAALTKLKRVCDHPAILLPGAKARDYRSGKFEVFTELLDESLRSGQKVVVFSQYLAMMDIIEEHLRGCGVPFADLRGDTRDRGEVVRRFNEREDCRVFVCSLMAGGVGIDLTSASVVIHYDRWWNAAREDQATDRVHRMGQRRGVQVFKLVTRGTLEEKIDRMIRDKGELLNSVVEVSEGSFTRFSREELIELLEDSRAETAPAAVSA